MNHRKIWKQHHGPIPKDETGRTMEIHHIDGDRSNNSIDNLKCVTIQEHYDIHFSQGDYGACYWIALRMNVTPEKMAEILSLSNQKRIDEGTHPLKDKKRSKEWAIQRTAEGKNPFLGGKIQSISNHKRAAEGTHNFQGTRSPSLKKFKCPYCEIVTNLGNLNRWHLHNCKRRIHNGNQSTC